MGSWRNRRRFFNHRQNRIPRPPHYELEPPDYEYPEGSVPSWEKKFCSLIGLVPWQKVVDAKKFMYSHSNIFNWDDSAGKDAFQNAKKRFWAEINGISCDISPPDPDMYIDEINWNPYVDADLIKDLECAFFAPDDEEKVSNVVSVPSEGFTGKKDDTRNPWECYNHRQGSVTWKDKAQGWNNWYTYMSNSSNLQAVENPWECRFSTEKKAVMGETWGDSGDILGGWNYNGNCISQSNNWDYRGNPWEHSCQGVGLVNNKGWNNSRNRSWRSKQQEYRKFNSGGNSWQHCSIQANGTPKARGWRDSGVNAWDGKQWDGHANEPKNLEFRKLGGDGSRGAWNEGSRKREGTHEYITGYKSIRVEGQDFRMGHCWRGGKTKKRGSFASQ